MSTPMNAMCMRLNQVAGAIQGAFTGNDVQVDDHGTVLRGEAAIARLQEEREAARDQILVRLWEVAESIDQQLADLDLAEPKAATLAERLDDVSDHDLVMELARRAQLRAQGGD